MQKNENKNVKILQISCFIFAYFEVNAYFL